MEEIVGPQYGSPQPNNTNKPFTCDQCPYSATQQKHLTRHVQEIHMELKNKKCQHCSYVTKRSAHLQQHMKAVHLNIKDHKCPHCSYEASRRAHLRKHMEGVHKIITDRYCGHETIQLSHLQPDMRAVRQHAKSHNKYPHYSYQTTQFTQSTLPPQLNMRELQHQHGIVSSNVVVGGNGLPKKMHKCPHCAYETARNAHLQQHMKAVHLNIKDYKCTLCNYEASRKAHLEKHMKVVHQIVKDLKCPHCTYETPERVDLQKHMCDVHQIVRAHKSHPRSYKASAQVGHFHIPINPMQQNAGQNPKCPHCSYEAKKVSHLKLHIRAAHHSVTDFHCPLCAFLHI